MKSAQRRNRLKSKSKKNYTFLALKIFLVPVLILLGFIFIKITTRFWNGSDKVSYTYRQKNGNIAIVVLDPKLDEEITLFIPGDTQVNVAGNYGTLRIKNVWQLGIDEARDGDLLAQTVTKNFNFPTFLWANDSAEALGGTSIPGAINFIFSPGKTNIPFGDRVGMTLFAMNVKSIDRTEIDLAESRYLQKTNLVDGKTGFLLNGPPSPRLTTYFSDNDFSDKNLKVEISDATGVFGTADKVGEIIQVLGGKVVSIDKKASPSDIDCIVVGKNPKIVSKISALFDCKKENNKSSFDLELRLGSHFAERF